MEKADEYLYMRGERYLLSLNLTDFLKGEASVEMSVNFETTKLPLGVGFFEINSELHCVGGERHRPEAPESDDESFDDLEFIFPNDESKPLRDIEISRPTTLAVDEDLPDLNSHLVEEYPLGLKALNARVYKFDRNHDPIIAEEISPMIAGKVDVVTTQIDGNIYVLSREPLLCGIHPPRPTFEMYDSSLNSWRALPEPPSRQDSISDGRVSSYYVCCFQSLDKRIIMRDVSGTWTFDTTTETWTEFTDYADPGVPDPFSWDGSIAVHKHTNIMLAFTPTAGLVAYMSAIRFRVLHEVNCLFPKANLRRGFLVSFDEGDEEVMFCAVFIEATDHIVATISVFQLEINDEGDSFTVHIQRTGTYPISTQSSNPSSSRDDNIPINHCFILSTSSLDWSSFCFIVLFHKLVVHILQFLICLLS